MQKTLTDPVAAAGAHGDLLPHWLRLDWHDRYWRYWLLTTALLFAGLAGWSECHLAAAGLTLVQVIHLAYDGHEPTSFPIQVRMAYFTLLCLALVPGMAWVMWLPAIGTPTMLISGYCPLARFMALVPWNRNEPLDLPLLRRVLLTPPGDGIALDLVDVGPEPGLHGQ